jgi:FkbM family methyltransferase
MSEIWSVLHSLLNEPKIIVEIGAADGLDTIKLLNVFKNAHIYVFEPDPRNIEKFKNNLTSLRVSFAGKAISNYNGFGKMYLSGTAENADGWTYSSSLKKPNLHLVMAPWCVFNKQTRVEVVTLDSALNHLESEIDFIWADVQGSEGEIIAGGQQILNKTRYFYTEYYNDQIYEGQINIDQIQKLLPGTWEVVSRWGCDVLFKNKSLP